MPENLRQTASWFTQYLFWKTRLVYSNNHFSTGLVRLFLLILFSLFSSILSQYFSFYLYRLSVSTLLIWAQASPTRDDTYYFSPSYILVTKSLFYLAASRPMPVERYWFHFGSPKNPCKQGSRFGLNGCVTKQMWWMPVSGYVVMMLWSKMIVINLNVLSCHEAKVLGLSTRREKSFSWRQCPCNNE